VNFGEKKVWLPVKVERGQRMDKFGTRSRYAEGELRSKKIFFLGGGGLTLKLGEKEA
jgi:hypothetical protein